MKVCYTELVETGHIKEVGGTLEISITTNENDFSNIPDIIDKLDHTTIIPKDKEKFKKLSDRYFIVEENESKNNFIKDIFVILSKLLPDIEYKIKIKYNKFAYSIDNVEIKNLKNELIEISEELK